MIAIEPGEGIDRAQREPAEDVEPERLVFETVEHHEPHVIVAITAHQLQEEARLANPPHAQHREPAWRAGPELLHALRQLLQLDGAVVKGAAGNRVLVPNTRRAYGLPFKLAPKAGNFASWQLCQC
jgi:hypothetical protein